MQRGVSPVGLTSQPCTYLFIPTLFISPCWKVHPHTAPRPSENIIIPELEIVGNPKTALAGLAAELGGLGWEHWALGCVGWGAEQGASRSSPFQPKAAPREGRGAWPGCGEPGGTVPGDAPLRTVP